MTRATVLTAAQRFACWRVPSACRHRSGPPARPRILLKATPHRRGGQRIRSASVTVDGKRVAVKKRGGRHIATVAPRRLARDVVVVKITVRYTDGSRKRITKRIRTCA